MSRWSIDEPDPFGWEDRCPDCGYSISTCHCIREDAQPESDRVSEAAEVEPTRQLRRRAS